MEGPLRVPFPTEAVSTILALAVTAATYWHIFGPGNRSVPQPTVHVQISPPPPPSIAPGRLPDYRLKWLGANALSVSVSGDWTGWSRSGVPMARDEDSVWATDVYLPEHCPRRNLMLLGVCCYRYEFFVDLGTRQRWLFDPQQPMDKDPDGWVHNYMCKYVSGKEGRPLPMLPLGMEKGVDPEGGGGGGGAPLTHAGAARMAAAAAADSASSAAAARASSTATTTTTTTAAATVDVCFVLPATYLNGTSVGSTSTRGLGGCCEACRRKRGCMAFNWRPLAVTPAFNWRPLAVTPAYNWRPEPLPRNCVFFGSHYGTPRGTALSSAGLVRVPLRASPPLPSSPLTPTAAAPAQLPRTAAGATSHHEKAHHRRKKPQRLKKSNRTGLNRSSSHSTAKYQGQKR